MIISPTDLEVADLEADAIVVGIDAQGTLTKEAQAVDAATGGLLARLVASGEISGKLGKVAILLAPAGIKAAQVAVVGLGESQRSGEVKRTGPRRPPRNALAERPRRRVAFFLGDGWTEQQVESGVCGAMIGCRGQDLYRTEKNLHPFEEILWVRSRPFHPADRTWRRTLGGRGASGRAGSGHRGGHACHRPAPAPCRPQRRLGPCQRDRRQRLPSGAARPSRLLAGRGLSTTPREDLMRVLCAVLAR